MPEYLSKRCLVCFANWIVSFHDQITQDLVLATILHVRAHTHSQVILHSSSSVESSGVTHICNGTYVPLDICRI